ncbi:MAG: histidine kinase [Chloroflexi bacterium]|nr:histidine kinase [Chloroflexota bacterium]
MLIRPFTLLRDRFWRGDWAGPYEVRFAAVVSVWVRWCVAALCVALIAQRPFDYPASQYTSYWVFVGLLIAFNGFIHHRLWSGRTLAGRWMMALSATDVALVTALVWISGGFSTLFTHLLYYPALAAFAVLFTSLKLNLVWVTLVALTYALVCLTVGGGLDWDAREDVTLVVRVAVMYTVVLAVNLVARFERAGRLKATAREGALQQERIDLSQSIHDTAAQSVYMIGLGVDSARSLAGDSNAELSETLEATSQLSRSVMWELRRSIDAGQLFEGRDLGSVLREHTETFQRITSVPTRMTQSGVEPELSVDTRSRLFSIAHNALTNAFRHAGAGRVDVVLDFKVDGIRLTVEDDGVGLPDDYAQRGRGVAGMRADAERIGGRLLVTSGGPGSGTSVTCVIPIETTG